MKWAVSIAIAIAAALIAGACSRAENSPAQPSSPRVYFDDFPIFENWIDQGSRHAHDTSVTVERAESPGGLTLAVNTGGMPVTTLRIEIAADARGELVGTCAGTWSTDQPGNARSQDIHVLGGMLFVNSNYPVRANPLHVKFALAYEVDGRRSMISGGFAVSY